MKSTSSTLTSTVATDASDDDCNAKINFSRSEEEISDKLRVDGRGCGPTNTVVPAGTIATLLHSSNSSSWSHHSEFGSTDPQCYGSVAMRLANAEIPYDSPEAQCKDVAGSSMAPARPIRFGPSTARRRIGSVAADARSRSPYAHRGVRRR